MLLRDRLAGLPLNPILVRVGRDLLDQVFGTDRIIFDAIENRLDSCQRPNTGRPAVRSGFDPNRDGPCLVAPISASQIGDRQLKVPIIAMPILLIRPAWNGCVAQEHPRYPSPSDEDDGAGRPVRYRPHD